MAILRKEVGAQREFSFQAASHVDVGERLGMFDFETGGKVCGSRFVYLTGAGAMLELALINWAMAKVVSKGFKPMIVPDLVRQSTMEKCGFQPRAENTQVYAIENSDLCLAGTAEILLGGVCMDEVLSEKQLPIKMAAFSHCFRTEAGAAGASTRGLYRLHQFSKVEMFVVSTPEQSEAIHDELIGIETEMYAELGFHFKVLDMSSQDLGAPAYRKFDVEAWMPALGRYGEISSASNCTDYQARRLNIKYRPEGVTEDGKKQNLRHCHTLNATACAVPRMIVTILENFQNEDGSVTVPEPLRPFMGGIATLTPAIVADDETAP
jgi:seryl-tRNA synthetase